MPVKFILLILFFGCAGTAFVQESDSEPLDPDRAQAMLDISSGKDPEAIEEIQKDIRSILEDDLQVTLHYLAYRSAVLLGRAYLGVRTNSVNLNRKIKGKLPYSRINDAADIFNTITSPQLERLEEVFKEWGLEGSISFYLKEWLQSEKTVLGRSYWKHFKDGETIERILLIQPAKITRSNFAAIALLASLIEMEIYDEDAPGEKIRENLLAALQIHKESGESLSSKKNKPSFNRFFNERYFSQLQVETFRDKSFTKFFKLALEKEPDFGEVATINQATGATSAAIERAGSHAKFSARPSMTKFWSIASLRRRMIRSFTSLKPKWPFSLGHFAGNFAKGSAISVVAEALVESAVVLAVGQRKEEIVIGDREIEYDTQKTTRQKGEGWFQEYLDDRKFAFLDMADNAADNWESRVGGLAGGVAFAALVGTSFPLTLVAAAVGYAVYSGVQAVTKMGWYQKFKHRGLISDLEKVLKEMPYVRDKLKYDEKKIEKVAQERARDMIKRKEIGQQSPRRIYFLDQLSSVKFDKDGDYWFMKNQEAKHGRVFNVEAHMRYDILDVKGNQGVWDLKTPVGIHNVGNLSFTNGLDVGFISADATFDFHEGNKVLKSKDGSNFRVLSNGSIWTRDDDNPTRWIVKGLTNKTDLVIRGGKGRFTIDPDRAVHTYVTKTFLVLPDMTTHEESVTLEDSKESAQTEQEIDRKTLSSELSSAGGNQQEQEVLEDA
ncbi:hypothetical protein HOF92_10110, partial [bacterium]|nr:hypothetical protein [bacterium]